ncbi:GM20509 [Drosophila sechellia]|uniref:GM20509 n=1 Tax=Drosophila sechellia TaxID=7238 RepID=B4HMR7_DROSE|nr:GM20509 [Drosophila sechellia]
MKSPSSYVSNSSQTPPPIGGSSSASSAQALIRDYWYELKFSDLFKFINPDGRYQCPRFNCLKSYKDASSLQRHIRYECGGQKKFRCLMCGKAFSQSSHLKRHLESGVCVKYYL